MNVATGIVFGLAGLCVWQGATNVEFGVYGFLTTFFWLMGGALFAFLGLGLSECGKPLQMYKNGKLTKLFGGER